MGELAARLRSGEISAQALAEAALENARHDAYRTLDPELLRAQAAAADAAFAAHRDLGPLQGLPVSVKDLFGVPGLPVFAGSSARLPRRFERPGPLVTRVLGQLALVVGKTHTVQFAFGGIGTNPHHATPGNPTVPGHAPGGSSAGAGVSLAEGSALLALGTDTAGSVRIPAAWTGQCALKTTKGRWSTDGIVPLSTSLDTPGLLARSVADLTYGFRALDPAPAPITAPAPAALHLARATGLFRSELDAGIDAALDTALEKLRGAGARVSEASLPGADEAFALFRQGGPVSAELKAFLAAELPAHLEALDPNVRTRIDDGAGISAEEYLHRLRQLRELAAGADAALRGTPLLVTPTTANGPPTLKALADAAVYRRENLRCLRNTGVVSYLGLSALTLPAGRDAVGRPVGLQLIGRAGDEERLLGAAATVEAVLRD